MKLAFNCLSTGTMAAMGRVAGNWMSWVSISNKKLIDRGIRLLVELGGISYEEAAQRLFAAEEWVESQDWTGKETPCAVQGKATMPTRKARTDLKMPPFALQPGDGRPLARQVVDGLREAVAGGYYSHGDRIPDYRALATALGVSAFVTKAAVRRLALEGVLEACLSRGTFGCAAFRAGHGAATWCSRA